MASDTLLRLVRFAAAACEARYAFVASARADDGVAPASVQLWAARDFGLRIECHTLDLGAGQNAPRVPVDFVSAMQRVWPDEEALQRLASAGTCICVPLLDGAGRLLGHLGALDSGTACLYARDRLPALAHVAAAQLLAWSTQSS